MRARALAARRSLLIRIKRPPDELSLSSSLPSCPPIYIPLRFLEPRTRLFSLLLFFLYLFLSLSPRLYIYTELQRQRLSSFRLPLPRGIEVSLDRLSCRDI